MFPSAQNRQTNKEKTGRQTHMQETKKLTKKNSKGKHKWRRAECDHVKKGRKEKQRSRFL
jgi:hypothetical protein